MNSTSRTQVADIRDRMEVRGSYLVRAKTLRTARNGKPYLTLELADRTGSVEGRAWEDAERIDALCDVGVVVEVRGRASSYQGQLQLNVDAVQPVPPEAVVLEDFLPRSAYPLDDLYAALRAIVEDVTDPWIRRLLLAIVEDPEFAPRLRVAVAAKVMHHAYLGGLVEHSVSMCRVALGLHAHYERLYPGMLDRDLLVAGALLHDIGKVFEIGTSAAFDYTDEGRLVGHIVQGVELITEKARQIDGFPADILARVKHLVVAHHGKLEFGSPRTPAMAEALLLHLVDMLDARMNAMYGALRDEAGRDWTRYNRMLEGALLNPFAAVPVDEEGRALLPERGADWLGDAVGPPSTPGGNASADAETPRASAKRRSKRPPDEDGGTSDGLKDGSPKDGSPKDGSPKDGGPKDGGPSNLSLF